MKSQFFNHRFMGDALYKAMGVIDHRQNTDIIFLYKIIDFCCFIIVFWEPVEFAGVAIQIVFQFGEIVFLDISELFLFINVHNPNPGIIQICQ